MGLSGSAVEPGGTGLVMVRSEVIYDTNTKTKKWSQQKQLYMMEKFIESTKNTSM